MAVFARVRNDLYISFAGTEDFVCWNQISIDIDVVKQIRVNPGNGILCSPKNPAARLLQNAENPRGMVKRNKVRRACTRVQKKISVLSFVGGSQGFYTSVCVHSQTISVTIRKRTESRRETIGQ